MYYPFSMYGRIIRIHRYKAEYAEIIPWPDEYGGPVEKTRVEYCNTREQAEAVTAAHESSTITQLDSAAYEWLDGIEVAGVPDTYAEAVKIYEAGQAAYDAELSKPTPEEQAAALEQVENALCEQDAAMDQRMSALEDAVCELDAAIHQGGGETT